MLGLEDPWIIAAYLGSVFSTLLCIVYGVLNWNKGGENEAAEIAEEELWETEEHALEETL
jgi:hypothetical protein